MRRIGTQATSSHDAFVTWLQECQGMHLVHCKTQQYKRTFTRFVLEDPRSRANQTRSLCAKFLAIKLLRNFCTMLLAHARPCCNIQSEEHDAIAPCVQPITILCSLRSPIFVEVCLQPSIITRGALSPLKLAEASRKQTRFSEYNLYR